MKLGIMLLIAISGVLLASSLQQANSELLSNGKYILQGSGFAATEESIDDSALDLQFSTGKLTNTRMKVTLEDGLISFLNDDYIASGSWAGTVLGNGKFISLSGDAENTNGDKISLSILARLVQNSKDASVYSVTGKITKDGESTKLAYSTKVTGSSIVKETPTQQETPKEKTIQISILAGSSKPENIKYYSLSTVQITPGTTIIWKNDDTTSHRIMSGAASFSHGKPFKPDGKIDSGDIAPGQTFSVIIKEIGITRFFDSTYSWMDGVIVSLPEAESKSLKAQKYK